MKLSEIDRIEAVEKFRSKEIFFPRKDIINEEVLLIDDLIGFEVILKSDSQLENIKEEIKFAIIEGYYPTSQSQGLFKVEVTNKKIKIQLHKKENDFFIPAELSTFSKIDSEKKTVKIENLDFYWW